MSKSTPVPYIPGHYYHLYNRGCNRENLFREPENYRYALYLMGKYAGVVHTSIIAYVLMPNHYHFLVRQDGDLPANRLTQYAFNTYSKAFNLRYERSGTLFESQGKVIYIDKEKYLLHLCRYIHANPIKAGLVEKLEDWPYSNYLDWAGLREGTLVDHQFIREAFGEPVFYTEFVKEYVEDQKALPHEVNGYLID